MRWFVKFQVFEALVAESKEAKTFTNGTIRNNMGGTNDLFNIEQVGHASVFLYVSSFTFSFIYWIR